jgi:hypothetical protein
MKIERTITTLFMCMSFAFGAIIGASIVSTNASERYRELQYDYNEKMMLRDTDKGAMYVK